MATVDNTFCTLCDPSSVLASLWCPECNDFLCFECEQHHRKFRPTKDHSIITIGKYSELPQFVKDLKFTCDDHEQRYDSYCSAHNMPICIRCLLTSHKTCQNVVPMADLVNNSRTSPAMDDLETSISDLISYLDALLVEIETQKKNFPIQEKTIRDEISKQRRALNAHLDKLEKNLLKDLHTTFSTNFIEIETLAADITKITESVQCISTDLAKIRADASDLQSFLSIQHLQDMVTEKEKYIEILKRDKLVRKDLNFIDKSGIITSVESFGDVTNKNSKFSTQFLKSKEKEAQLVGTISHVSHKPVILELVESKAFTLDTKNVISGVAVTSEGNILIAERNNMTCIDRVSLHDNRGKLIKYRKNAGGETLFNLSRLQNTSPEIALLTLFRSDRPHLMLFGTDKLNNTKTFTIDINCYGVTGYDKNVFMCTEKGIRKFKTNEKGKTLLMECVFENFSFIDYHDQKLYFTRGEGYSIVSCCDESGKHLWTFEDSKMLQEARGVVVDTRGRVFVAGKKSNNIVCLTPDGKVAKEVMRVSSPLALCFDEKNSQLIVCNETDTAHIFRVCEK